LLIIRIAGSELLFGGKPPYNIIRMWRNYVNENEQTAERIPAILTPL
jgi:hypothetical protein